MPSEEVILPTLKSRLLIIKNSEENIILKTAEDFLKLSQNDKITFIDKFVEKINEEKANKIDAIIFLNTLEIVLYKNGFEKNVKSLKSILKAKDYMNDRSPSIKQLMEYVALNC